MDVQNNLTPGNTSLAHGKPFLLAFSACLIIGYVLYFLALWQSETPPAWVGRLIEGMRQSIKAIETAARISDHPFPAQVMILYASLSTLVLTAYFVYCVFAREDIRRAFNDRFEERLAVIGVTAATRWKIAFAGLFIALCSFSLFPLLLFVHDSGRPSWRVLMFFSPSVGSASFLLLASGVAAWGITLGMWLISQSAVHSKQ
jgi:hypothetical protein